MKKLGDNAGQLAGALQVEEISVVSWISGERLPNKRCLDLIGEYLGLRDDIKAFSLKASGH